MGSMFPGNSLRLFVGYDHPSFDSRCVSLPGCHTHASDSEYSVLVVLTSGELYTSNAKPARSTARFRSNGGRWLSQAPVSDSESHPDNELRVVLFCGDSVLSESDALLLMAL